MRFHGGGRRQTTENAKFEASLNLRFAESGTKKPSESCKNSIEHENVLLTSRALLSKHTVELRHDVGEKALDGERARQAKLVI